jgi:phytoene desaturase
MNTIVSRLKTNHDILIVGAGLAGIAVSIRLANAGFNVLIIEKNSTYGGKMQEFENLGFRWDNGPSLFTEPFRIDELFTLCNKDPRDYFNYIKHSESCRYYFNDDTSLTLHSDKAKTVKEIKTIINEDEANSYLNYIEKSQRDYNEIGALFLNEPKRTIKGYLKKDLRKHYPFFFGKKFRSSLSKYNSKSFSSEKMRKVFNRYGTYNGSNPFEMSGLYSMIPSLELNHGTFFPTQGMRGIVDALYELSLDMGVEYKFETTVSSSKKDVFIHEHSNGEKSSSTYLISAIDHVNFKKKVLGLNQSKTPKDLSTSGLVFYWGLDTKIPGIGLHNIFFSKNYEAEFDTIFKKRKNHNQPTIYIHNSSVVCPGDAPAGGSNWFVMINTSAMDDPSDEYIGQMRSYIIRLIKDRFNVNLENHFVTESIWKNSDIESITGSFKGALYGESSNSLSSTLKRHGNKDKRISNLYYCGGTVHPGGGIPLVTRSAEIVANMIIEHDKA